MDSDDLDGELLNETSNYFQINQSELSILAPFIEEEIGERKSKKKMESQFNKKKIFSNSHYDDT